MKYQSSSTHYSKVISKVKVSERRKELQNDRMTELQNDRQDKNNMPPDLRSQGHKNAILTYKYANFYFDLTIISEKRFVSNNEFNSTSLHT